MTTKEKVSLWLLVVVIVLGGILNAAGILSKAASEDRIYVPVTEENRDSVYWKDIFYEYNGDIRVNWNTVLNHNGQETYEVHLNGFTYWWTKEAIAEYVTSH